MSQQQEYWFAARTRKDQELTTRDALENRCRVFLPTQFVIRQLKYRRRRVEVPVIRNLIFVHATKEFACAIANEYGCVFSICVILTLRVCLLFLISR